jgi:hypothetical protein
LIEVNRLPKCIALTIVLGSLATSCERGKIEYPVCDVNEAGISDSTIGPLHIDEALPAVRVRCPAAGDTVVAPRSDGSTGAVPALRLIVVGAPVIILHDGNKVTGLRVESPFFRTNDSLGVGTSIAKFRNVAGIRVQRASGTSQPVLLDRRRCGVAYELSGWGSALPLESDPPVRGAALIDWPDSVVVRAVTVTGCHGNTRDLGVDSLAESFVDSIVPPVDSNPVSSPLPAVSPATPLPTFDPARRDSAAPSPMPAELAALAARLDVPVQGITRPQLRDTYAEPRGGRVHEALDIPAARGTPVISATDGRVLRLFNSKTGGLMVYAADPSDRFILLYGHLDRYAEGLRDGMRLERGQVIGYVGTTGNAPIGTPHLHFGILSGRPTVSWSTGAPVNPFPLLVPPR